MTLNSNLKTRIFLFLQTLLVAAAVLFFSLATDQVLFYYLIVDPFISVLFYVYLIFLILIIYFAIPPLTELVPNLLLPPKETSVRLSGLSKKYHLTQDSPTKEWLKILILPTLFTAWLMLVFVSYRQLNQGTPHSIYYFLTTLFVSIIARAIPMKNAPKMNA